MVHTGSGAEVSLQDEIERFERKCARVLVTKHLVRLEARRRHHSVPVGQDVAIDGGRRSLSPSLDHLAAAGFNEALYLVHGLTQIPRYLLGTRGHPQHILSGILRSWGVRHLPFGVD